MINKNTLLTGLLMFILGIILTVAVIVPTTTKADSNASKVGTVDFQRSLSETPAGKRATDQFDHTRRQKQSLLDTRQKELRSAAAQLDKEAATLKPEVLSQKKSELEKSFAELQQFYTKLENELVKDKGKLLEDIAKQAEPAIQKIAKQEGYTMVLSRDSVLWVNDTDDLTDKINAYLK